MRAMARFVCVPDRGKERSMETRNVLGGGVVAVAMLALSSNAFAQQAVQWRVEDGGNGHWYRVVSASTCWPDAVLLSESFGGYLTALNTTGEQSFVMTALAPIGEVWVGGFRDSKSDLFSGWQWLTGEEWNPNAVSWAAGNPGCCAPNEYHLGLWEGSGLHDLQACFPMTGLLIEWSADCNDDGIVDYGQILDGSVSDANGNGVPDGCECLGDLTGDRHIDGYDLSAVLANWGVAGSGKINADVTGDGTVDFLDLAVVLGGWGACSP